MMDGRMNVGGDLEDPYCRTYSTSSPSVRKNIPDQDTERGHFWYCKWVVFWREETNLFDTGHHARPRDTPTKTWRRWMSFRGPVLVNARERVKDSWDSGGILIDLLDACAIYLCSRMFPTWPIWATTSLFNLILA